MNTNDLTKRRSYLKSLDWSTHYSDFQARYSNLQVVKGTWPTSLSLYLSRSLSLSLYIYIYIYIYRAQIDLIKNYLYSIGILAVIYNINYSNRIQIQEIFVKRSLRETIIVYKGLSWAETICVQKNAYYWIEITTWNHIIISIR